MVRTSLCHLYFVVMVLEVMGGGVTGVESDSNVGEHEVRPLTVSDMRSYKESLSEMVPVNSTGPKLEALERSMVVSAVKLFLTPHVHDHKWGEKKFVDQLISRRGISKPLKDMSHAERNLMMVTAAIQSIIDERKKEVHGRGKHENSEKDLKFHALQVVKNKTGPESPTHVVNDDGFTLANSADAHSLMEKYQLNKKSKELRVAMRKRNNQLDFDKNVGEGREVRKHVVYGHEIIPDGVIDGLDVKICKLQGGWPCSDVRPRCILEAYVCDGISNCHDHSDESRVACGSNYTIKCHAGAHACAGGNVACVPDLWLCDTIRDCDDASDESWELCGHICVKHPEAHFNCKNGTVACIWKDQLCDGTPQCSDESDEDATMCLNRCLHNVPSPFFCHTGPPLCIPGEQRCDANFDCRDRSDEEEEECEDFCMSHVRSPFYCDLGHPYCIPGHKVCDGVADCISTVGQSVNDWSDESKAACGMYCSTETNGTVFHCVSERPYCIPQSRTCDGHRDCSDGSDESGGTCGGDCQSDVAFHCGRGHPACVKSDVVCDGLTDCQYGQDESTLVCDLHTDSWYSNVMGKQSRGTYDRKIVVGK